MSPKLIKLLEDEDVFVMLSSISIWELVLLVEKKRIKLKSGIETFLKQAMNALPYQEVPVTSGIAIASRALAFKHADPADKFIAATANVCDVPLVTQDQKMAELSFVKIIS